jgi:hypothetical protein
VDEEEQQSPIAMIRFATTPTVRPASSFQHYTTYASGLLVGFRIAIYLAISLAHAQRPPLANQNQGILLFGFCTSTFFTLSPARHLSWKGVDHVGLWLPGRR